jgi:hypothetical protein
MGFTYKKYDASKLTAADFDRLIPLRLYKYHRINDFLLQLFENHSLWFSRPSDFNDPFDCRLKVAMGRTKEDVMENLKQYQGLLKMKTRKLQQVWDKVMDDPVFYNDFMNKVHQVYINEKLGVCCFCEAPTNVLMWAHYAASHTGVCLEFEVPRNGFFYQNLLPVQYKKRYPQFLLSNYNKQQRNLYTMHQQAVCTKSHLWEYEQEWRMLVDTGAGNYPFDKQNLRKVIFGAQTQESDIDTIKGLLQKLHYTNTQIFRMEPLGKTYGLRMKRLV